MCPFRAIRRDALLRPRHARDDLWLEPRNADARGAGRAAHHRAAGRASPPRRRRLEGFGQSARHPEGELAHPCRPLRASLLEGAAIGASRRAGPGGTFDEPEPCFRHHRVGDQAGLDHGGVLAPGDRQRAIAAYVSARLPEQRNFSRLVRDGCSGFIIGAFWWQQSLWKLPPHYTDHPDAPFGKTGLAYWMKMMGKHASIPLQADFVNHIVLPNFYLFAPIVYAARIADRRVADARRLRAACSGSSARCRSSICGSACTARRTNGRGPTSSYRSAADVCGPLLRAQPRHRRIAHGGAGHPRAGCALPNPRRRGLAPVSDGISLSRHRRGCSGFRAPRSARPRRGCGALRCRPHALSSRRGRSGRPS